MPQKIPLEPGAYYHIFNRGNNRENIFYNPENYSYFLRLYKKHIFPIAKTYAYALLPNHYHFIVQIRAESELPSSYQNNNRSLSFPFGNWQNAYAKALNKKYERVSSLFEDRFERVRIKSEARFTQLIFYVHLNPQKHGCISDFKKYPYSSFLSHLSNQPTKLEREMVLEWFGGQMEFAVAHQEYQQEWIKYASSILDDYD